jgi:hypothetical protein
MIVCCPGWIVPIQSGQQTLWFVPCLYTIPYLHIQPSSWRWILGFETCRRHRN